MFDENPLIFFLSAPGAVTGRADLYAAVEGEMAISDSLATMRATRTYGHGSKRERGNQEIRDVRKPARGRGGLAHQGVSKQHPKQSRPTARSDKAETWRRGTKSLESSPDGPNPLQRRGHSEPNSPTGPAATSPSPPPFPNLEETLTIPATEHQQFVHIVATPDAITAVMRLRAAKSVALKVFGITRTVTGSLINSIAITARNRDATLPIYVFDLVRLPSVGEFLKPLLEDARVNKIVYGANRDCTAIAGHLRVTINPFTDLAIMSRMLSHGNYESDLSFSILAQRYGVSAPESAVDWEQFNAFQALPTEVIPLAAQEIFNVNEVHDRLVAELNGSVAPMQAPPRAFALAETSILEGTIADAATLISLTKAGRESGFEISFVRHNPFRITLDTIDSASRIAAGAFDLNMVLSALPEHVGAAIQSLPNRENLREISLDLGRVPNVTVDDGSSFPLPKCEPTSTIEPMLLAVAATSLKIAPEQVTESNIHQVIKAWQLGKRVGLPGTLHYVAGTRNTSNSVIGLSVHIGVHYLGYGRLIEDVIDEVHGRCGNSATGVAVFGSRTSPQHCASMMRDIACNLSTTDKHLKVAVLDPNEQITGASDIQVDLIGSSRRVLIPQGTAQPSILAQIVTNYRSDAIILGEMTAADVSAMRDAAANGVSMIARIPAVGMVAAVQSRSYQNLFGRFGQAKPGTYVVPALRRNNSGFKCQTHGVFAYVIEIVASGRVHIHSNMDQELEALLNSQPAFVEERWIASDGKVYGRYVQLPQLDEMAIKQITES